MPGGYRVAVSTSSPSHKFCFLTRQSNFCDNYSAKRIEKSTWQGFCETSLILVLKTPAIMPFHTSGYVPYLEHFVTSVSVSGGK